MASPAEEMVCNQCGQIIVGKAMKVGVQLLARNIFIKMWYSSYGAK